jgi:ribosomal protein S18 acetylase RimI-like enzyme
MPWSAEFQRDFLAGQFNAQRHHYRANIPGCVYQVLEHEGTGVGRLYLDWRRTQLHIVDIALLPVFRGRGLGTALLAALQDEGRAQDLPVGIFVEKFNRALVLYRRLGFAEIADHGVYLEMEWSPAAPGQLNVA